MAIYHGIAHEIVSTIQPVFGSELPALREQLGLGVQDLADMLEVSRTTLYRMETENRELTPAACLLIQYLRSYAA